MSPSMEDPFHPFIERINKFRDERQWRQFHTLKDSAISLALEAAELLEVTQWQTDAALTNLTPERRLALQKELVDVLYWVLTIAHDQGIDLTQAFEAKMAENEAKYPAATWKGTAGKYSDNRS